MALQSTLLFLLLIFHNSAQFSLPHRHAKPICNDFFEHACKFQHGSENWFQKLSNDNAEDIKTIISKFKANFTVKLGRTCDSVQNFDGILHNVNTFLADSKALLHKVLLLEVSDRPEVCYVRFQFENENLVTGIKALKSLALQTISAEAQPKNFNFTAYVDSTEMAEKWTRNFFATNRIISYFKPTVFDKTKMFYSQCKSQFPTIHSTGHSKKGLKTLSDSLKNISEFKMPREGLLSNPFCKSEASGSAQCRAFSETLAEFHKLSAVPLFATRVVDLIKTRLSDREKITAVMQTHFVGNHDPKSRVENCFVDPSEIAFDDVAFDSDEESSDQISFDRFSLLSDIMEKGLSDEEIVDIALFEKKLFKYSIATRELTSGRILEKNSTIFSLETLGKTFPGIVAWEVYFEELFGSEKSKFEELQFLVICPSFLHSLQTLLEKTNPNTAMHYIELSSFFTLNRKFPQVFTDEQMEVLNLKETITCEFLTEVGFPLPTAKLFSDYYKLKKQEDKVSEMIDRLKDVFVELIGEQMWMSEDVKKEAIVKINRIKSIVGLPRVNNSTEDLNNHYKGLVIEDDFIQTLMNIKKFNLAQLYQSMFDPSDVFSVLMHYLPGEANASYDLRDNEITVNVGIMRPPFVSEKSTTLEIYSRLGFILGHEITHSLGLQGLKFSSEGLYKTKGDRFTRENYNLKMRKLEPIVVSLCSKKSEYEGKRLEYVPNFKHIKDEIIADLGGAKVALRAYKKSKGSRFKKKYGAKFFAKLSEIFCQKESVEQLLKDHAESTHPPDFCRLNVLSQTPDFAEANGCASRGDNTNIW